MRCSPLHSDLHTPHCTGKRFCRYCQALGSTNSRGTLRRWKPWWRQPWMKMSHEDKTRNWQALRRFCTCPFHKHCNHQYLSLYSRDCTCTHQHRYYRLPCETNPKDSLDTLAPQESRRICPCRNRRTTHSHSLTWTSRLRIQNIPVCLRRFLNFWLRILVFSDTLLD